MSKIIAIIPARGGSKRIPRKNIKEFCGKPIIAYSIEAAKKAGCFDEIMVSTDDTEIAEISKKYGAAVPFFRSEENSNDHAGLSEVVVEVLNEYKGRNISFEYFCLILPTAPFLEGEILLKGFKDLKEKKYSSIFPVVRFSFPIQRALKIKKNRVLMFWPDQYNKRSQDLEPAYHDAGQFYFARTDSFLNYKKLYTDNSGYIVLSETGAQDIDSMEDWILAEAKYKLNAKK